MDEPRKRFGAMIAGLDIMTAGGPTRVHALLREARPVLLDFAATYADDRVKRIDATLSGVVELPVVGQVPLPPAVLVRPDGHVAWAGDGGVEGLRAACAVWFGRGFGA